MGAVVVVGGVVVESSTTIVGVPLVALGTPDGESEGEVGTRSAWRRGGVGGPGGGELDESVDDEDDAGRGEVVVGGGVGGMRTGSRRGVKWEGKP